MNTLKFPILLAIAFLVIASPITAQFYTPIVLDARLTKFIGQTNSLSATMEFIRINHGRPERWPVRIAMRNGMTRVDMDISKAKIELSPQEGAGYMRYVETMKTAGSAESVTIYNPVKKADFLMLPQLKGYTSMPITDAYPGEILRAPKSEKMEVGREEFGGRACTIYKFSFEQDVHGDESVNEDSVAAFVWITKEFGDCPVRINVINIAGQTNMTLLLTDIDLKAPAADFFEPPKDFKKYENVEALIKRARENLFSKTGQPEKSLEEEVRAEAEKGNAQAQFLLGANYGSGLGGLKKDEAEAVKWYRKAAEQGLANAQSALGVMYSTGLGIPKDEIEAYKWMLLAVEQGSVDFAVGNLEMLARHLTSAQRAEGERMAREFKLKKVAPPKNP